MIRKFQSPSLGASHHLRRGAPFLARTNYRFLISPQTLAPLPTQTTTKPILLVPFFAPLPFLEAFRLIPNTIEFA
jgi:hypothetical protein